MSCVSPFINSKQVSHTHLLLGESKLKTSRTRQCPFTTLDLCPWTCPQKWVETYCSHLSPLTLDSKLREKDLTPIKRQHKDFLSHRAQRQAGMYLTKPEGSTHSPQLIENLSFLHHEAETCTLWLVYFFAIAPLAFK